MLKTQQFCEVNSASDHRACLQISKESIAKNIKNLRQMLPNKFNLVSVVKANAYGLGIENILPILESENIDFVAVINLEEALAVRRLNNNISILILDEVSIHSIDVAIKNKFSFCIYSEAFLNQLKHLLKDKLKRLNVHIKVNTGMNRLGCELKTAYSLCQSILKLGIKLEGICSHYASVDDDLNQSKLQLDKFITFCEGLFSEGIITQDTYIHIANSLALHHLNHPFCNMARIGLGFYKNAIKLVSKVRFVQEATSMDSIGYNATYFIQENHRIAVVSCGYADGLPSLLANTGVVYINQVKYPIVGKICMDWFMVDLGQNKFDIQQGDEVNIIDPGFFDITLESVSNLAQLNPRALLCQLGPRVKKIVL